MGEISTKMDMQMNHGVRLVLSYRYEEILVDPLFFWL